MGLLKAIGDGIRNLGEAGKELFRGIGDAIAGAPRTISETYTQRQKTIRQRDRLATFERMESGRAVAVRQGSGAPSPSVGHLPAAPSPAALWDPAQARHDRELEQRRSELRLGEMHAQHLLNVKEINERGCVERQSATHGAELARGTATHQAELDRQTAAHRAGLERENQRYAADLRLEMDRTRQETEFYRSVSPFAEVHPRLAAAQVAAATPATAPTLVLAPIRVVGKPARGDDEFGQLLATQLVQDLDAARLAHVYPGLFRRPLEQSETDVTRVREALSGLPVILVHGEIIDGYRAWIHLVAWNIVMETPTAGPDPDADRSLHRAARPQGLLLPPAVRLTLPFPMPEDGGDRARRRSQEQVARATGAVSGMLAQWYGVAAGEDPRPPLGLPRGLDPVPQATALGTGALLDICVDRGLWDESDALLRQADVYRQSGFTEYALDSARRAARIITPGDEHDQRAYLERVDRLVAVLRALNENGLAGDIQGRAEQAARRSTHRRLGSEEGPAS
ncbi:hypothetical protein [Streptomyces sp. NPDC047123]|uniref:hypothetical protein n=1 Tax=Streptomyces sp. NPDC047123 TaxID=3155622 RepID=UPI0033D8E92D